MISYTRTYSGIIPGISREWAILPFDKKFGPLEIMKPELLKVSPTPSLSMALDGSAVS